MAVGVGSVPVGGAGTDEIRARTDEIRRTDGEGISLASEKKGPPSPSTIHLALMALALHSMLRYMFHDEQ